MAVIFDSDWVSKSPPAIGKAKESALLVRVAFLTARECADAALHSTRCAWAARSSHPRGGTRACTAQNPPHRKCTWRWGGADPPPRNSRTQGVTKRRRVASLGHLSDLLAFLKFLGPRFRHRHAGMAEFRGIRPVAPEWRNSGGIRTAVIQQRDPMQCMGATWVHC